MKKRNVKVSIPIRYVTIVLASLLAGIGIALAVYYGWYLVEFHEVPADFRVEGGVAGLNADTDALHFGTIIPGGFSRRALTIEPAHDARVRISVSNSLAAYIAPDVNDFPVSAGENVTILFTAAVPSDIPTGDYNGTVSFRFYRE